MGGERDWFYPAALMTLLLGAVAWTCDGTPLPLFAIFPLWLIVGLIALGLMTLGFVTSLIVRGEQHPLAMVRSALRGAGWPLIGFGLAGINLCSFMRVKPALNRLVGFTADPLLARMDRAILFGHDGADLLRILNTDAAAVFYSRAWFTFLVIALLLTLFRPPSPSRTRLIVVYFALWTFAGPIVHLAMPAAGPIFYRLVGAGNHFEHLTMSSKLTEMRDYLWSCFMTGQAGPGAGISAMPSLHVATTAWAALAIRQIFPAATFLVAAFTAMIVTLSVALGWHYLVDGLVGIGCTLLLLMAQPTIERAYSRRAGPATA